MGISDAILFIYFFAYSRISDLYLLIQYIGAFALFLSNTGSIFVLGWWRLCFSKCGSKGEL